MTVYTELAGDARTAFEDMVSIIWAEAQRQQGLSEDDLTLRDLLPAEDCGLSTNGAGVDDWLFTTTSTAAATINYFTVTVDTARFLGIYGVGLGGALASLRNIAGIRVQRGGKVLRRWTLQPYAQNAAETASAGDPKVFFMDDPVTCFQRIPLTLEVIKVAAVADRAGGSTATVAMMGRVVEPEGKAVNRSPALRYA